MMPAFDKTVPFIGKWIQNTFTIFATGAQQDFNLWIVHGVVQIYDLYATVITQIGANCTAFYWSVWDGALESPISRKAPGLDISGYPPGSLVVRDQSVAADAAGYSSATSFFHEQGDSPFEPFIVGEKNGATTYIRASVTDAGAGDGVMCCNCQWRPVCSTTGRRGSYLEVV